ncbi:BTAD domain-containing putative transcriptional regulator [Micromonospora chaiyaphumensis]|uniref:DNA-binding transcriptional activator of the SARP family n=1 Tax=Micromonospora chaiyaphumensis TaxID=307119 RepID=A0A1C4UNW9_9ACTN|nr:BTAD domain-containing putative transcriptional regulator [Micromonospora chaiyaphumensis]SCE73386.1 DNA-binding transcriptional activator of the SARP family [Micromonospora chaiyaphumensis]
MQGEAGEAIGFSVLGPIRVVRAGAELRLGARQQRLVLALLLARAGQPVSLAELVDLLWDEEAPVSAANVVHRHVGMLRRLLEPGLPTRSVGRHLFRELSGYRLRADEESLDLLRFRSLSRRAAASLQDGDPEAALRHALDGLRLWRGRCAAGLEPASLRHPAFLAVEDERAQAVREAADAAEQCGRMGAVLGPLRQAAEQHPLDELLQSRLLLALAADGRQAEAVEMYRVVRRRLAEELGVDPGEELREAYDRLLHQRTRPPRTGSPAPLPRPAQLPPDLPFFAGRGDLVADARAAVARPDGPAVLAIDGMPGVGKTALAIHLAHGFAADYPDGQLYVDLRGYDGREPAMSPAEALRGFLGSLGVPQQGIPAELHAQAGLYRSSLAGRRMLIVLDNCRDAEQIRHLLPGSPGCLVIVTSRSRLSGLLTTAGAHPLPVGLPSVEEARAALSRPLGAGRVAADPAAIDAIIAACGRLPLALAVVAARAASLPRTPPAQIAAELAATPGSLDGFDGDDPQSGVRAVFSWSYRALSAPAAGLFRLLPVHPGPDLSVAGAAGLAGVPLRTARALLGELSRAHLVSEDPPGRYRTHDLLLSYATELGEEHDGPAERAAAELRCLRFYRATGYQAHRRLLTSEGHPLIDPGPGETPLRFAGHDDAMRWFTAERQVLIALVGRAARQGRHTDAWQLALGMQHFFDRSGRWADWTTTGEVALEAARAGGDLIGQARMHRSLAGAAYFRHEHEIALAHLDRALALLARLGLSGELTRATINRAMILSAQGRHEEVVRTVSATLGPWTAGDDKLLADALVIMAASNAELGRDDEAVRCAEQAMALSRRARYRLGVAEAWEALGKAYAARREVGRAIDCWREAAAAYQDAAAAAPAAEVLALLGDALAAEGDQEAAVRAWREGTALIPYAHTPTGRRLAGLLAAATPRR